MLGLYNNSTGQFDRPPRTYDSPDELSHSLVQTDFDLSAAMDGRYLDGEDD